MPVPNDLTDDEIAIFAAEGEAERLAPDPVEEPAVVAAPVAEPAPAIVEPASNATGADATANATGADATANATGADATANATGADAVGQDNRMVPHAALHQERQQRQALAQQLLTANTRMNALLAARQPAPEEVAPDINTDPAGLIQYLQNQVAELRQERTTDAQHQQLDNALQQDEATFAAITPDYQAASEHYVKSRGQELLMFMDAASAQKVMGDEVREIARQSWQRGRPAAETIYTLAQARGYVPGGKSYQPGGDRIERPAMPAGAPATPAAVVAAVRAGQQAGRSLSGNGGGVATAATAETLLAMSDAEFEKYLKLGTGDANDIFKQVGGI